MPAPNFPKLYEFEDAVEAAARSILTRHGFTAMIAREDSIASTPRVDISCVIGAATRHYGHRASDGEIFLDRWNGSLNFDVITDRVKNREQHRPLRAKLRWLMQDLSLWTPELLPYHQVVELIESGSTPEVNNEKEQDFSALAFNLVLGIRADAWPESP